MQDDTQNSKPNALIHESSPYLLQHAYNPVEWLPWGEIALARAKVENKLILVSIGYSACHWCHVMERESFMDAQVAAIMNEHFICIKVDREERPDIDHIYMEAVQLMTQSGGWPLNCFCLPDGRPVYGGTYFPKEQWLKILTQLAAQWHRAPDETQKYAARLHHTLQSIDRVAEKSNDETPYTIAHIAKAYILLKEKFDNTHGGTHHLPKFPMPSIWWFLLRYAHFSQDQEAFAGLHLTLTQMARGGMYDQIGGGFARYSTDRRWYVPHFEKMLYDNAQLVSLYTEAYLATALPEYKKIVYQTLAFIERELTDEAGYFYAALDADSEGVEGKYYTWKQTEIEAILGELAPLFSVYYNTHSKGNWEEGENILIRTRSIEEIAHLFQLPATEVEAQIEAAHLRLLEIRNLRPRPGLDNKMITAWNALMCKAYTDAYCAFGEAKWLAMAEKNIHFILENMMEGNQLYRIYAQGKRSVNAYIDDYAFVIEALIRLYQVSFEESYIYNTQNLAEYCISHFLDKETGMFYFTSDQDTPLIVRKKELHDNVIPSGNSSLAHSFLTLATLLDEKKYKEIALQMLKNMYTDIEEYSSAFANWASLSLRMVFPDYEIGICGLRAHEERLALEKKYIPHKIVYGRTFPGKIPLLDGKVFDNQTRMYVCHKQHCWQPVDSAAQAHQLIQNQP